MANRSIGISEELAAYVVKVGAREPDVLARLREETAALPSTACRSRLRREPSSPCSPS